MPAQHCSPDERSPDERPPGEQGWKCAFVKHMGMHLRFSGRCSVSLRCLSFEWLWLWPVLGHHKKDSILLSSVKVCWFSFCTAVFCGSLKFIPREGRAYCTSLDNDIYYCFCRLPVARTPTPDLATIATRPIGKRDFFMNGLSPAR